MAASPSNDSVLDAPLTRRQHGILLAVGAAALVLRMAYLWGQARNNPLFPVVHGDAFDHHAWAQAIAVGPGMPPEPYYRAPLYYYLLAGLYSLIGPSVIWARIAGATLGALTSYLIARLGSNLAGYRAGLCAGLLAALYWPAIYFEGELLTAGLECLLEVTLILALWRATRKSSLPLLVLAGAVWGLCAITRPNFLILAPAIVAWLFLALPGSKFPARKWLATAVVFLGAALVIAPVTLRNVWVSGEPILITYSGGVNFYIGNNPDSDGIAAVLPGGRRSLRGGFEDARQIPQAELGRPLTHGEISEYWYAKGLAWMKSAPGDFARHLVHKVRLFWSPVEWPNNQPIRFVAERSQLPGFFLVGFPLIATLGLAGFVSMRRDWKRWFLPATFLVLYMGSVVLFFCNARYRLPIFPLLTLAAGAGLSRLPGLLREKRWSELLLFSAAGLMAALFLATNPPDNRAGFQTANRGEGHKSLGDHYAGSPLSDRNHHDVALAHYQEAVRLKPGSPYLQLALAREQIALGRRGKAELLLGRAARQFPVNAEIRLELARALAASQQWVQALQEFESAIALQPAFGAAQQGLGCLLARIGRYRRALEPLQKARSLQTRPLQVHLCTGTARLGLGQADQALAEFTLALALDPLSASALQGIGDAHTLRGDLNPAIAHYRMALKQNANLPASSQNLASALGRIRQYPERISVLDAAVRQSPGDGELLAALAFALATTPQPHLRQGEQALGYAKRALAAHSPPAIEALDAQAAALAELNRFDAATKIALQALTIARAQGRSDRISGLERRLRGYRSGLPYRDPDPGAPPAP